MALWREGLLAQKVLAGQTRGYKHHPQLQRFRATHNPVGAIASYLRVVADEADRRGYRFDRRRILNKRIHTTLFVTRGQLEYEFVHLLKKLKTRDPVRFRCIRDERSIECHSLFKVVAGDVENWEAVSRTGQR